MLLLSLLLVLLVLLLLFFLFLLLVVIRILSRVQLALVEVEPEPVDLVGLDCAGHEGLARGQPRAAGRRAGLDLLEAFVESLKE